MKQTLKTKTVKQSATFAAAPHEVYEMLMDSKLHSRFSDAKAKIGRKIGDKFTAYDGWIEGVNKELVKDRKIVQFWRGADWPPKHYSIATFKLSKSGKGTKLSFLQTGVPVDKFKDISEGWKEHYWEKMKDFIENK